MSRCLICVEVLAVTVLAVTPQQSPPQFELVQAELFSAAGGQTNAWADFDNDGDLDEFVGFRGRANRLYRDVLPDLVKTHDASHGVQWIDFDNDGALDLALANNDAQGGHYLFHNRLTADRARASIAIDVVDARGRHTKSGAEVRVYAAGTRRLISSALVDSGSGYCSQNVMPAHLGVAGHARVDVEVTVLTKSGRKIVAHRNVDPRTAPRPLVINARQ